MTHAVTLIPGDGIGPEVMESACRVVEATGIELSWEVHDIGSAATARGLKPIPDETMASMRRTVATLKGPASTVAGRWGMASVNVEVRRALDMYVQVRPCRTRPGTPSSFQDVDLVVIRGTTEDLYAGIEFEAGSEGARRVVSAAADHGRGEIPSDAGLSIKFTTERATRRVLEFAFSWALSHGRRVVTAAHKATVMRCTDGIFLEQARSVAAAFPDLVYNEYQVDNLCGQLLRRPGEFDVLVMGMAYGDIVSDVAAGLVGGIGVAPGVNVGDRAVMFEPAHGTSAHYAGQNKVNPTAAILCGALLLDHLGEADAARRVEGAVDRVIAAGDAVTYDLRRAGDSRPAAGTEAMTDAIVATLAAL